MKPTEIAKGFSKDLLSLTSEVRPYDDLEKLEGHKRSRLTPELQNEICLNLLDGMHLYPAIEAAGVDVVSFRSWMTKAIENPRSKFARLKRAVKKAQKLAEGRMVRAVTKAALEDGFVALAYLKARHPDRWGRKPKQQLELSGAIGMNAMVICKDVTTEEIDAELARRARTVEGTVRVLEEGDES